MSYIGNQPSQSNIQTNSIADLSVTTVKLANGAATLAKLDTTGSAGQILTANGAGSAPSWQSAASVGVPAGAVMGYAGTAAPSGWLLCAGQSVSTTTYAALFSAIGYAYGGAGASFNLPDYRGRVPVGKDDMGGTAAGRVTSAKSGVNGAALGAVGGAEVHKLTVAETPAHQHLMVANVSGSTSSASVSATQYIAAANNPGNGYSYDLLGTATAATLGLTSSVGGGGDHNNMQPSIIQNYIIKT